MPENPMLRRRPNAMLVAVTASLLGVVAFADPAAAASGGGCYTWTENIGNKGYLVMGPCISAQLTNVYPDTYTDFSHTTIAWQSCKIHIYIERDGAWIDFVTKDCTVAAQNRLTAAYFIGPYKVNSGTHRYRTWYFVSGRSTTGGYYDVEPVYSPWQYMP